MSRPLLLSLLLALLLIVAGCAKRPTEPNKDRLSLESQIPFVGYPYHLVVGGDWLYGALDQGGVAQYNANDHRFNMYNQLVAEDGSEVVLYRIRKVGYVPEREMVFINEVRGTDQVYIAKANDPDSLRIFDAITGETQDIQDIICRNLENDPDGNILEVLYCTIATIKYGRFNGSLWLGSELTINTELSIASLDMDDQYIYVAGQQAGLFIYSRTDGKLISNINTVGDVQKVVVAGDKAYIAAKHNGLKIVDLSDIEHPFELGSYETTGYATDLAYHNGKVILASGSGGAYYFDVSTPHRPKLIQRMVEPGYALNVAFMQGKAVIATRSNGLFIYKK
ncbi:MAG: hypothetical protein PHC50_04050 [Candidatus Cloacimonetes bacterium]|nr:hypothetical protein [Candidatus Cloacimonadota bacterium]